MNQLEKFSLGKQLKPKGSIQKIGIVGCGAVGQPVVLQVAQYGMDVVFLDVSEERIKEIFTDLEMQLDAIIKHWGITASEKRLILSRITGTTKYEDFKDCDIVIETISSRKRGTMVEIRREIFKSIEKFVKKSTVIASNLSTLMISDLAEVLEHKDRATGVHFIEPIDKTKIVEVMRAVETSDKTVELISRFLRMINKRAIVIHESPGNISTRILLPVLNEACEVLMEGVASVQDIDDTMKEIMGYNVGPFELADRIGLDKILKFMDNLYAEYGDKKYKASPILKRLVRANYIGKRVGKGFYNYEGNKPVSNTITCAIIK
jgi:3-hydroxybutyryl-CoA dehydrogenase